MRPLPSRQPEGGRIGYGLQADNGGGTAATTSGDRAAVLLAKAHSWEGRIDRLVGRSDSISEAAGRMLDLHGFREPLAGRTGKHEHCDDPWCKFCRQIGERQSNPHAGTDCGCIFDTTSAKHPLGWWGADGNLRYFTTDRPRHRAATV